MPNIALQTPQALRQQSRLRIPDNVKQTARALKFMRNPAAELQALAMQNPLIQQMQQVAAQYGGDYNRAFYDLCQQNGIDPNYIMAELRELM